MQIKEITFTQTKLKQMQFEELNMHFYQKMPCVMCHMSPVKYRLSPVTQTREKSRFLFCWLPEGTIDNKRTLQLMD